MSHAHKKMKSPVGELTLVASEKGLAAILWEDDDSVRVRVDVGPEDPRHPVLVEAERQLNEYFAGARREFSVALDLVGTPFQQTVWRALLGIPFGETRSYGELARQIGHPGAARAVGAANGKNPVSIIAPCHRVVGSSGEFTGFAGGLAAKELLLRLEGARGLETESHPPGLEEIGSSRRGLPPRASDRERTQFRTKDHS